MDRTSPTCFEDAGNILTRFCTVPSQASYRYSVQSPERFDLVINLKTAKAIGVDVPAQLQQLADEIID
jgi:hypothetical protein